MLTILQDDGMIVSVCRIVIIGGKYYQEGLKHIVTIIKKVLQTSYL